MIAKIDCWTQFLNYYSQDFGHIIHLPIYRQSVFGRIDMPNFFNRTGMSYVYFIKEDETNFFKIGNTSDDVEESLKQLQVGNPRELKVFGVIECDNPAGKEKEIHDIWDDRCIRGEWFNFTDFQALDILKAHGGSRLSDQASKLSCKSVKVPDAERESIVLLAYERAIQRRAEPSTGYIEKVTEELGNRVPRTTVWHILNSLKSEGRLPTILEQQN